MQLEQWTDGDTRELVTRLTDCAEMFGHTEQLRERIAAIVRPVGDRLKRAPLLPDEWGVSPGENSNAQAFGYGWNACREAMQTGKPRALQISVEWVERMARLEQGHTISAGVPDRGVDS